MKDKLSNIQQDGTIITFEAAEALAVATSPRLMKTQPLATIRITNNNGNTTFRHIINLQGVQICA